MPLVAVCVLALAACSDTDDTPNLSSRVLKNTELVTILKSKGYSFNEEGKLVLNDLAQNTTSLDLSGTKLKDFEDLDMLPNLKEVILKNNGYGPSFDFSKLPAQITGIDLTGNDIHGYNNLVDVKVAENEEETVTNLRNITKLYLPAEAKYNIKDLVRFYRQNKADIEAGKIDMKMEGTDGKLQPYNTLREISNPLVFEMYKTNFSSILSADGKHIDLSKRLNNADKLNICGVMLDESSSTDLDGIQYVIENPYWEGNTIAIYGKENKAAVLPTIKVGDKLHLLLLHYVNAEKGINFDDAKELTGVYFVRAHGLKTIDFSHSTLFGQRDPKFEQDGQEASSILLFDCPDLTEMKYPNRNDLCVNYLDLVHLPKLTKIDLSPFKQITQLDISMFTFDGSITYPDLKTFHDSKKKTEFGCNMEIFNKPETKQFIKKYYNSDPKRLTDNILLFYNMTKEEKLKLNLIRWESPKYIDMLNN